MIELSLKDGSHLDGMSLIDLRKKYDLNFLISVVKRGDEVYIPDGNFVLKTGDHICLTANFIEIQKLLKTLGLAKKQSKSVMILGATTTSYYLAKMLYAGEDVKFIARSNEIMMLLAK